MIQAPIFVFTLLVSLIASIIMTSYELFRQNLEDKISRLKEAELENERLKRYELEARLNSLQAKLNPHFLFNTLNTTTALIYEAPQKAEATIVRLSDLYRKVLSISSQTFISVGEEIELIEDYLELEKLRFDENLSYHIECPDRLKSRRIPGLLIEPLVENAIKYSLEQSRHTLKIEIAIEEKGNNLFIEVRDNGPGFEVDKTNWGFGLFSIQERLRLLFGEEYGFDVNSTRGEGTRVKIRLPLEAV